MHSLAGERVGVSVDRAGLDDAPSYGALFGGLEGHVEEARPGDIDLGNARCLAKPAGEQFGDLARRAACRFGQLKGHIRGVIAVLSVLGTLDGHGLRRFDGKLSSHDGSRDGSDHGIGKLRGGHGRRLSQHGARLVRVNSDVQRSTSSARASASS
jgi:hypothetical protein